MGEACEKVADWSESEGEAGVGVDGHVNERESECVSVTEPHG